MAASLGYWTSCARDAVTRPALGPRPAYITCCRDQNLIHGARAVLPSLVERETPLGRWVRGLLARAHKNIVVVALANKLARIAWAVLAHGTAYGAGSEAATA